MPDGRTFAYVLHEAPPRLTITQNDVRQIQLAKAALWAGCRLLMDELGIETVDRIRLAGAFGAHIDPVHALVLGLVPDCDPAGVTAAGNAAGTGARIALLNRAARTEIEEVVRRVYKVEQYAATRRQQYAGEHDRRHDGDQDDDHRTITATTSMARNTPAGRGSASGATSTTGTPMAITGTRRTTTTDTVATTNLALTPRPEPAWPTITADGCTPTSRWTRRSGGAA